MKSLEQFYQIIEKNIYVCQSHLNNKHFGDLIRGCSLVPIGKTKHSVLTRDWIDPFGATLSLVKNQRVKINTYSLNNEKPKLRYDMGKGFEYSYEVAQYVFINHGFDELGEYKLISFIDDNKKIKTYILGEYYPITPLVLGYSNLSFIYNNLDINFFVEKKNSKCLSCEKEKCWLGKKPFCKEFEDILETIL